MLDLATTKASRLSDKPLNANLGRPFSWYKDSRSLLVSTIPATRPALVDSKKSVPAGPTISVSDGSKAQNRTYPDMLKNKSDEANFETLVTSELYQIGLDGTATLFKGKDMYLDETFSPDGNYLMVSTIQKPFSYLVPLYRFPSKTVVYDLTGKAIKLVNDVPFKRGFTERFYGGA